MVLHDCVHKQQASHSESNDHIYVFLSARSSNLLYMKLLYSVASTFLSFICSASLSGSDDFDLCDSLDGIRAYSQMLYAIFQFCTQVKFTSSKFTFTSAYDIGLL